MSEFPFATICLLISAVVATSISPPSSLPSRPHFSVATSSLLSSVSFSEYRICPLLCKAPNSFSVPTTNSNLIRLCGELIQCSLWPNQNWPMSYKFSEMEKNWVKSYKERYPSHKRRGAKKGDAEGFCLKRYEKDSSSEETVTEKSKPKRKNSGRGLRRRSQIESLY